MKGIITVAAILFAIALPAGSFAADGAKLGYVDIQKVLSLSNAGKAAKEQLDTKAKKYQEEINRKQEEMKKLKDVIEKQGQLLSESAKNAKEKEYQQLLKDTQRLYKDAQDDMQAKEQELMTKIFIDIQKVVQEYGRKNSFTFIFIRNDGMIYADEKAELTDQVLALVNTIKK